MRRRSLSQPEAHQPAVLVPLAARLTAKHRLDLLDRDATRVGNLAEGVITRGSFSLDLATKRPAVGTVNDMFKKRSGKDLNDNTSRQFMAMLVLADAINRAQASDGDKIRAALAAADIPGEKTIMPWKDVKFDEQGQNDDCDPVLLQWVKGKFVTIFPPQAAVAEVLWPMNKA